MRRMIAIVALLFMFAGLYFILKQPVQAWLEQRQISEELSAFERLRSVEQTQNTNNRETQKAIEGGPDTDLATEEVAHEDDSALETSPETTRGPYSELLQDMQEYNLRIYETNQSGLVDAWSYEQTGFDLSNYGLEEDIIGVLTIPAMETELPIYLGATKENMSKGVAVLGQTSMPVGGENTNCVIAGHRGYNGLPFLREIQQLEVGDPVYVTTYWGELSYQVEQITIIEPDDLDAIHIQAGRELLTLITCHPYTVNTHRYVVYCSAVEPENQNQTTQTSNLEEGLPDTTNKAENLGTAEDPMEYDSTPTVQNTDAAKINLERWLPLIAIPLVIIAGLLLFWPGKKKKKRKNADGFKKGGLCE